MPRLTPDEQRVRNYAVARCLDCGWCHHQRPGDSKSTLRSARARHERATGHVLVTARSVLPFDIDAQRRAR